MELVVPVRLRVGVGGGDERLVDLAQLHELRVGQRGRGAARRQPRDQPEDPVVVDDVGALEPSDERAAPGTASMRLSLASSMSARAPAAG